MTGRCDMARGMTGAKAYLRCFRTPPECGKAARGAERTPLGPAAASLPTEPSAQPSRAGRLRGVQQVLNARHAVHRARLLDQLPDLLGSLDLAAQIDDPMLDVHVDGSL